MDGGEPAVPRALSRTDATIVAILDELLGAVAVGDRVALEAAGERLRVYDREGTAGPIRLAALAARSAIRRMGAGAG